MATKKKAVAEMQPVDALTGKLTGQRFTVILDDIKIGDKWLPSTLPLLQKDGLGKTVLKEGFTSFQFCDVCKSTIDFTAVAGELQVTQFRAEVQPTDEGVDDDSVAESV